MSSAIRGSATRCWGELHRPFVTHRIEEALNVRIQHPPHFLKLQGHAQPDVMITVVNASQIPTLISVNQNSGSPSPQPIANVSFEFPSLLAGYELVPAGSTKIACWQTILSGVERSGRVAIGMCCGNHVTDQY